MTKEKLKTLKDMTTWMPIVSANTNLFDGILKNEHWALMTSGEHTEPPDDEGYLNRNELQDLITEWINAIREAQTEAYSAREVDSLIPVGGVELYYHANEADDFEAAIRLLEKIFLKEVKNGDIDK